MKSNMRNLFLILPCLLLLAGSISCKQLREMKAMSKCQFRLINIDLLSLDNIDISRIRTPGDLDALTVIRLGNSLLSGKLPLTYRANIESKNPNSENAAINQFELNILFNNVNLVQTVIQERYEVKSGETAKIPVQLTSDIAHIVKGESISNVLGWLFPGNDTPAVFTVKIKPSVLVGPVALSYPGFITLSKDFKSQ